MLAGKFLFFGIATLQQHASCLRLFVFHLRRVPPLDTDDELLRLLPLH